MKLSTVLLFVCALQLSATVYSQKTRVTFSMKDTSMKDVFNKIEENTDFRFFYNESFIDLKKVVTVEANNDEVARILDNLFKATDVTYKILNNNLVVITPKSLVQQQIVTGKVTDSQTGEPIAGVNVVVKGTTTGTMTDVSGNFSLNVPDKNAALVFSFVGYATQEIPLEGRTSLNVSLVSETVGLEEVVVIGYGVKKKVDIIGSIATVSNKEIGISPVSVVTNALAGRLPGVIVQQGSGQPGFDEATILIRGTATLGNSSPLVVVDGVAGRNINSIEPGDIESITILKDASASIYGAQAANGVILVTSKRGMESTKPTFNYEFYKGIATPTMLPELADAATYAQMIREMQSYKNIPESNMSYSLEDIEKYKSGEYPWTHPNTNWLDASLKKYTNSDHHTFSINGGTKNVKYYSSFGSQHDDYIFKNSDANYKRYTLRANVDIVINEYLNIGVDINGTQEKRLTPIYSQNTIYASLIRGRPTDTAIWPNGYIAPSLNDGTNTGITGTLGPGSINDQRYQSQNGLKATLKVPKIEGLTLSGYYFYDVGFSVVKDFRKPWINYNLNKNAYLAAGNTGKEDGTDYLMGVKVAVPEPRLRDSYGDNNTQFLNVKANYDKKIGDHSLSAFIAYEFSQYKDKGISAFRRYFISDKLPYLFAGSVNEQTIESSVSIDARVNYFGRVSYNYCEKYLFEFTFRHDGSIRFSKETGRWGNFPSVLLGWRISNENFWRDHIPFINYFKLRASWGQMGNDKVDPFQYLTSYGFGTGTVFGTDKLYTSALYPSGTSNPLITWEVANILNIGFESRFLNNKMKFDAEYFYQRRDKILVKRNASVPNFTGISLPDENFGIVENKGLEAVLGYFNKIGDFSISVNGNLAYAKNSIVEFDEPAKSVPWQVLTGHPVGSILLYKAIGVFNDEADVLSYPHVSGAQPGDIIIEDISGDGIINNDDRIIFEKTADPKVTYGITLEMNYKNWGLSALVQGVGNCMRDMYQPISGTGGNYFAYDADGRWTPDNIYANKPRAWEREEYYWRTNYKTDYTYQNAAFARLKNLQFSYKIPQKIQKAFLLQGAELYFSGQNLLLFYSGNKLMDPEIGKITNYPLMKVYAFGAKIAF